MSAVASAQSWTVIGGGFGLYGYLPAALTFRHIRVILPVAYKSALLSRQELAPLVSQVQWVADPDEAIAKADSVVIAVPPSEQERIFYKIINTKTVDRLIFEKPVGANPVRAAKLILAATSFPMSYRIAYTMLHSSWFGRDQITRMLSSQNLSIVWKFTAHHFHSGIQTWKKMHDSGGGPLRFYGIHLIALLASLGYETFSSSELLTDSNSETIRWRGVLQGQNLPLCRVDIDTNSPQQEFYICEESGSRYKRIVNKKSPFDGYTPGKPDARIVPLRSVFQSFFEDDVYYVALYNKINQLWSSAETAVTS